MDYELLPKLNKEYILKNVSQEYIFKYYWGIEVVEGVDLCNPTRTDNSPGCRFYYKDGVLRFHDFAGYFHGDCFDAVAFIEKVNIKTRDGFKYILNKIAKDLRLHKYKSKSVEKDTIIRNLFIQVVRQKRKEKYSIKYVVRPLNKYDEVYWHKIKVHLAYLKHFSVFPAQEIYINNFPAYDYNTNDPAYVFDFGDVIRVYFPFRKEKRFLSNGYFLQGLQVLEPALICIITKSYKDVIAIKAVTNKYFSITSVAPPTETYILKEEEVKYLKQNCVFLISLFDFDKTGRKTAFALKRKYGIEPFFFTRGEFKTKDYGAKDFTDYLEKVGTNSVRELIQSILDKYENVINQYYNNLYNLLPNELFKSKE